MEESFLSAPSDPSLARRASLVASFRRSQRLLQTVSQRLNISYQPLVCLHRRLERVDVQATIAEDAEEHG